MAIYKSTAISAVYPVTVHGDRNSPQVAIATVACAAAPSTTDTMQFFYLPKNAVVLDATLSSTDMDTNGSPTITLNIGDSGSATRLFSASTVAQAGTAAAAAVANRGYQYPAKTLVTGVAQANAATGAAGSVTLTVLYVVVDPITS